MAFTVTVSGHAPRGVRLQPDVSASEQSGRGGRAPAAAAPSAPQLKFHIDEDFFKWPTNVWPSEAVGVALNSQKHIFLLNRGNVPLLEFAPDGAFIRSMGEGSTIFHAAHSVRFDAEDNMWLVDAGNNVVVKFNDKGRIVQALGRLLEPWVYKMALDGTVLGTFGKLGRLPGWFDSIHAIACPDEKTVYIANEFSFRFDKVVIDEPARSQE